MVERGPCHPQPSPSPLTGEGLTLLLLAFRRYLVGEIDIGLVVDIQERIEIRVELGEASFVQMQNVHFLEHVDNTVAVGFDVFFHCPQAGQRIKRHATVLSAY